MLVASSDRVTERDVGDDEVQLLELIEHCLGGSPDPPAGSPRLVARR
jgi:hypothetical protein